MIIMIDNYDSFTYNLVQYMAELGADVRIVMARSMLPLNEIYPTAPP